MIYELATAIGNSVCACLYVEPEDTDADVLLDGFACYCENTESDGNLKCCLAIVWAGHEPDLCCGIIVTPSILDRQEAEYPCSGPHFVRFNIEFRTCPPNVDPANGNFNDATEYNKYTNFMLAVIERLVSCYSCIKSIPYNDGLTPRNGLVRNEVVFSPTNTGVVFGLEIQLG